VVVAKIERAVFAKHHIDWPHARDVIKPAGWPVMGMDSEPACCSCLMVV
jgi:hypothetical protein